MEEGRNTSRNSSGNRYLETKNAVAGGNRNLSLFGNMKRKQSNNRMQLSQSNTIRDSAHRKKRNDSSFDSSISDKHKVNADQENIP